jgi:hypothetical protein
MAAPSHTLTSSFRPVNGYQLSLRSLSLCGLLLSVALGNISLKPQGRLIKTARSFHYSLLIIHRLRREPRARWKLDRLWGADSFPHSAVNIVLRNTNYLYIHIYIC